MLGVVMDTSFVREGGGVFPSSSVSCTRRLRTEHEQLKLNPVSAVKYYFWNLVESGTSLSWLTFVRYIIIHVDLDIIVILL